VKLYTGRTYDRHRYCQGCGARITIGEPKAGDDTTWWQRLTLTAEQRDLLLIGAAEYEDLCEDTGTISNAVEFVDWCSVEAVPRSLRRFG
jgi:hypothetical protein